MKLSAALLAVAAATATVGFTGAEGPGLGPGAAMAQMVPFDPYGLLPPRRIDIVVRSAGLFPVAPPMRRGVNYIVRAIDRYGTPMRLVVDGYYGQILAAHRIASLYPRGMPGPQFDPSADPRVAPGDVAPGNRPYAPTGPRPGAAAPRNDAAVANVAPARPTATAPVPRAKPSPASSADVSAAVKPGPEQSPARPSATTPAVTEKAPEKPADPAFPPVQPLE
ncbi:MAG TPA: hypothetical protein VK281_01855 [Xanthobacteraceae bacterium]|nr:hypothetical protein [Xanthobacteraceae bacterium]